MARIRRSSLRQQLVDSRFGASVLQFQLFSLYLSRCVHSEASVGAQLQQRIFVVVALLPLLLPPQDLILLFQLFRKCQRLDLRRGSSKVNGRNPKLAVRSSCWELRRFVPFANLRGKFSACPTSFSMAVSAVSRIRSSPRRDNLSLACLLLCSRATTTCWPPS
jgi:hypothetical protein